jgi:regulator of replication initiation timing
LDSKENFDTNLKVSPRFENLMKEVYNIKDESGLFIEADNAVKLEIAHLKDRIQEARINNEQLIALEIK